jgi:glycosyltransferase involved in cell wall biosynthesis
MKLLFVVPGLAYPPRTGSAIISYNRIKHLSQRHSIHLIAFQGKAKPAEIAEFQRLCSNTHLVQSPSVWQQYVYKGWSALTGQPVFISSYISNSMKSAVERHLRTSSYDVVVFQQTEMAQFCPAWYRAATILSMENPMVVSHQRVLESATSWYSRFRWRNRMLRLRRYEQRHVSRFNRVLLINQADVDACREVLPDARLDWAPHGIDVDAFRPGDPAARREGMVVITGNMYHPPNIEGVEFFCRNVWPLVRQSAPSASLWLVGAGPTATVKNFSNTDHIKVTGSVADIRDYLTQASVSVCPVRLRIGTQTKILEALACGTPVVTTSAGNNGIGAVSGEHLYVADNAGEMAARVTSLLEGQRWAALSENGRRFVVEEFAWANGTAKFEKILEAVLRESRQ